MWRLDILVQGYPGKSVCHGGLGWSTITLLRGHERVALVDVGSFGQRGPIVQQLARHGLLPGDVTDVLLTHSHWDHAINWVMFPRAKIAIGGAELDWSVSVPWGAGPVPELYVRELQFSPRLRRLEDGDVALPGVTAHPAPGHTPGHLIFHMTGPERDVLFTGDAAKNRAELLSLTADMTDDPALSRASMEAIWRRWRARPGTLLIPGHDLPMQLDATGMPEYVGTRTVAISAWFGDGLEQTTRIELVA